MSTNPRWSSSFSAGDRRPGHAGRSPRRLHSPVVARGHTIVSQFYVRTAENRDPRAEHTITDYTPPACSPNWLL